MHCGKAAGNRETGLKEKYVDPDALGLALISYSADRSGQIQLAFGNGVDTRRGSEVERK